MSTSSEMESADKALALQLQDEELALVLQFDDYGYSDWKFDWAPVRQIPQASSSASTSSSKREYPASAIWVDKLVTDYFRVEDLNLPPSNSEKECGICFETLPAYFFVSTPGCTHEYCSCCCQKHAEAKITSGRLEIKCPDESCGQNYDMEQCQLLLSESSFNSLIVRLTEAAIPEALKVFCPFADCSAFMEKSASTGSQAELFAECYECHRGFCQECKVPWHTNKTCGERRAEEINTKVSGDERLRELARNQKWQNCPKCGHIISRHQGCIHMTCLCGHEFCYGCGANWKDGSEACRCRA